MKTLALAFNSAWHVLAVGIVLGAGIPALFAFGVRGLAASSGQMTDDSTPRAWGKPVAAVCFLLVCAAIALGLTIIVSSGFGMKVSFEHIYPTLVEKK